jgi:DNA-directed RNA polymerase II subunit RPB1
MDTILYSYDTDSIRQIDRIEFDIWGNRSILKASALGDTDGIMIPDLYENNEAKKNGLIDARLGTNGNDSVCVTCGMNTIFCGGHFGHITLAEHVFHIGYLQAVHKILSCICLRCSKVLVYKNEDEIKEIIKTKSGKERLTYMKAISKGIPYCQKQDYGCGNPVPKIKIDQKKTSSSINIITEIDLEGTKEDGTNEGKKKLRKILPPDVVYDILKGISDADCELLGMDPKRSRPEDMIHKIFPVPPVQMRPSTKGEFMGGSTMEDDLTHKLADIVKSNLRIIKNKENQTEANTKYNNDHMYLLQYHVTTYFDNDQLSLPKAEQKGKAFKSLSARIKTKEGRIRGNLMGKRNDFTARTVITSDPTIDNNQLGVPLKIAMNLTFPEVVTPYNFDYLTSLVRNGRDQYPGANFVFPATSMGTGKRVLPIDLRYRKEKIELHYGDVVERHLKDGDIVLLNRQPTLHKQSMMGHRIKVINDPSLMTYRLSVAITTPKLALLGVRGNLKRVYLV